MLRVSAEVYINLGAALEGVRNLLAVPWADRQIDRDATGHLVNSLTAIRAHCDQLNLPVTRDLVDGLAADYADTLPTYQMARGRWDGIERTFRAELRSRLFIAIPSHRAPFWTNPDHDLCGEEILPLLELLSASFPDVLYDVSEAGNCFACERYTACVYHQMRAAEYALIAVVDSLNLPNEKKVSWDRMIQGIEGEVKKLSSTKSVQDWKDREKRYSDLCSWLTLMKNGWRNPVSHIPRTYSEATARSLFSALRGLFEHLNNYGIVQADSKPKDSVGLPSDE